MLGVRVSRWTMGYFAAAIFFLFVGQATLAWIGLPTNGGLGRPLLLVAVHLLTVGWLTLLMLGALHQFIPVISNQPLASDKAAGIALVLAIVGLLSLLDGFAALAYPVGMPFLLPVGGTFLLLACGIACANLAVTLHRARPLAFSARFVAAALVSLLLTVLLGLVLALSIAVPQMPRSLSGAMLSHGLPLHLAAGVGGWFLLTGMGVGYKLLSMFVLAPEERGKLGKSVLLLTCVGLFLFWVASLLMLFSWTTPFTGILLWAKRCGGLVLLGGLWVYLVDMGRLYHTRKRRKLELNGRFGAWALFALGIGVALLVAAAITRWSPPLLTAAFYLLLMGYLTGLGLSQLYKIVPFLSWLQRFGPKVGREPVPRVQDLVDEPQATPWFVAYFVAVGLGTLAMIFDWDPLFRGVEAANALITLAIGVFLQRARHTQPKLGERPKPVVKAQA